jgi:UDP-GlcNAc:undecaprenyl-phosphate GlcNAc-1-phosphate transferase
VASLIAAGAVCWVWCLFATWLGPRVGYVDVPDGSDLKVHDRPAVPLGGVGIFLGVHIAATMEDALDPYLLAATSVVLVLGLVDDRRGLSPALRLVVEAFAAIVLVTGIEFERSVLELVLSVVLVLVAINAVNLFDGLDGLVGSVGVVTALGLAWLSQLDAVDAMPSLQLAAALLGFLVLGWHPARVFLGDSGAYVTGMVLAASMTGASGDGVVELLIAATLLGVFALDLLVTLFRRWRNNRPLFEGDRSHVYDQLRDRGWGIPKTVLAMAAVQSVLVSTTVGLDTAFHGWLVVVTVGALWAIVIALLASAGFLGWPRRAE